jgi:hypothetical protein
VCRSWSWASRTGCPSLPHGRIQLSKISYHHWFVIGLHRFTSIALCMLNTTWSSQSLTECGTNSCLFPLLLRYYPFLIIMFSSFSLLSIGMFSKSGGYWPDPSSGTAQALSETLDFDVELFAAYTLDWQERVLVIGEQFCSLICSALLSSPCSAVKCIAVQWYMVLSMHVIQSSHVPTTFLNNLNHHLIRTRR